MKIGWGIDVGVASLGFAVIELGSTAQPKELIDGVSTIYPAPTGGAERTRYKSMRTQNRRRKRRIASLRSELAHLFGIDADFDAEKAWPDLTDGFTADGKPRRNNSRVRLRAHGLSACLSGSDLARSILHIAKNRGQRLTRGLKDSPKADAQQQKKDAKERQTMAATANDTKAALTALAVELELDGDAHPAQLLMSRAGETGATRLKKDRRDALVFTRALMEAELEALLKAQQSYHVVLTDDVVKALLKNVFWEEELKAQAIGKCRYEVRGADGEIERRLPRGSDLFQRKRIYEEVNNLRLISTRTAAERPLDLAQRDSLITMLLDGEDLTAAKARAALDLKNDALADKTSLDVTDKRSGRKTSGKLQGHPLAAALAKVGALEQWRAFDESQREKTAQLVRTEDDVEVLQEELRALGFAEEVVEALCDARLPTAYSAAGETATRQLLTELKAGVISNYEAEKRAGLKSPDELPPSLERLPYYGEILRSSCVGGSGDPNDIDEIRFGRIPNPVVHVALNQLRKTANAYLALHGKPTRICVELARDLNKSSEDREKAEVEANKNRKKNEKYIETLGAHTRKLSRDDLTRIKLHDMQGGECMYTGKCICMEHLFDGSVEIDHILPRAETRDDGIANLALVFRDANQFKAKQPPFEAFSQGYAEQDYEHILQRAWKRGKSVYWRFRPDAMDHFRDQDAFQARFLNDTRYIAKMAAQYLKSVCVDPEGVISLNGRITSDLRAEWGLATVIRDLMIADGRLNAADVKRPKGGETGKELSARRKQMDKIRWDHRHHLLDAIVAACVTRSDVKRLQTLAARNTGVESAVEILADLRRADPEFGTVGICWQDGFRERVEAFLNGRRSEGVGDEQPVTAVVRKADHATWGQLHREINYGVICAVPRQPGQYVTRDHVKIADLSADQIDALGVPDTALKAVEEAMATGTPIWWGGDDPHSALRDNLAKDLARLRTTLMGLMENVPAEALEKATTEGGRKTARAKWATKKYILDSGQRRFTRIQIKSLRILKGPARHDGKPQRANVTGGNDRLIYFINGEGDRDLEVVSTLDANTKGFQERWRLEGGRPLFTLRKDDLVEMLVDPKAASPKRRIFRTVSFSPTKTAIDVEFLPVEESRAPKEVPNNVRTRIRSLRVFRDHAPVMVLCDRTGRVRWRGPRIN